MEWPWREAALLALGLVALALGLLVYAVDRDPNRSAWMPATLALAKRGSLGPWAGWVPSLLHSMAFGLFSAAALPARSWAAGFGALSWGLVNAVFELGQYPAAAQVLAGHLEDMSGQWTWARWLAAYFARGRFDPMDIAASLAGAVMAATLLRMVDRQTGARYAVP